MDDSEHGGPDFTRMIEKSARNQNVAQLVPTKSDKDIADELRQKLIQVYQPVLDVLTEGKKAGFEINVQTGSDGFQIVRLMNIQIMKQY